MTTETNPAEMQEGTPQAIPEGEVKNPSQTPSSGEEGNPTDPNLDNSSDDSENPEAQDINPDEVRRAIQEAQKKDRLAKERFHEIEKLEKENAELREKTQVKASSLDEDKVKEIVSKQFNQMNSKQQEQTLEKAETEFYVKNGIRPGTEIFQYLRQKVDQSGTQTLDQLNENLRLHYRDYTYEQPTVRQSVPSVGGKTRTSKSNNTKAMQYAELFGLTTEDYANYKK